MACRAPQITQACEFVFLTVCSEPGLLITRFSDCAGFWDKFISDGFYDLGPVSVGVDEGREGYYRLVFHTQKFINENWAKYFIIRRALPCYITIFRRLHQMNDSCRQAPRMHKIESARFF